MKRPTEFNTLQLSNILLRRFNFKSVNQWKWIRLFIAIGNALGIVCAIIGGMVLFGYWMHISLLYRPFDSGPATHPLTAVCILLLGLCTSWRWSGSQRWFFLPSALLVILFISLTLTDFFSLQSLVAPFTPFSQQVLTDLQAGRDNQMGINSAMMLGLLGLSVVFRGVYKHGLSQFCAFLALIFPAMSLVGYAFGYQQWFGSMSIITTFCGFCLTHSTLALTAHTGGIRALLSPRLGGRLGRLQLLFGWLVPFSVGLLLVNTVLQAEHNDVFGIYVILTCWSLSLLAIITALVHEHIDAMNRKVRSKMAPPAPTKTSSQKTGHDCFIQAAELALSGTSKRLEQNWLLLMAIDHFSEINLIYGPESGERVIHAVTRLIDRIGRDTDFQCHWGGEEFAIMLTNTDTKGAKKVASRLRREVQKIQLNKIVKSPDQLSVSIGLARSLSENENLYTLMERANTALQRAKKAEHNLPVFDPQSVVSQLT